jgi:anti-anti-sigma factor
VPCSASWAQTDDAAVVTLTGRLDAAARTKVVNVLMEAVFRGWGDLVIDMAGIDYIDSDGVAALLEVRAWLSKHRPVRIRLSPATWQVLHHMNLPSGIELEDPAPE